MKKRIFYHILFWAGYVFFKTYLNFISAGLPAESKPAFSLFMTMLVAQAALLIVKVPMVYILFAITGQYLSKKGSAVKAGISITFLFAASILVFLLINHFIVLKLIYKTPVGFSANFSFTSILYTFFVLSFTAGIAMVLKLTRLSIRQKEMQQEIMQKKLETELRFLKSQTNPHFLFNTLNNIYALARKKSDDTADVVMKLSKLLRFMLYESESMSIPVANELRMIDDYIELEKIRYNERLKITYEYSIDNNAQPVAPLVLLPFVENAFKHGTSETRFNSFINIDVKLKDGQLIFMIENSKSENAETAGTEKIGLNNVSRQLELMYPEHTLDIEDDAGRFKVVLKINLHKYATV